MNSNVAFEVAHDKLAQCQTSRELAEFFQYEGIKGFKKSAGHCPIARWMEQTTGLNTSVTAPNTLASEWLGLTFHEVDLSTRIANNTKAMKEFIYAFDEGKYPDLVECEISD